MLRSFCGESFDIIVQAGQSNSDGTGYGNAKRPFQPDGRIWYLLGDGTFLPAAERVQGNAVCGDFSLAFAQSYIKGNLLAPDRKLLIIRSAVGGTGFADKRWGLRDDLFLRMTRLTADALALSPRNRLKALLWHQGENDASAKAGYDTHRANLLGLLQHFRAAYGDVPFVAGDFVQQWIAENKAICAPIVAAIRAVCQEAQPAAFVETIGLQSNAEALGDCDTIHFCRQSLYELGERYFEAFLTVYKCDSAKRENNP
ncbi:MAG: sialate O-acetylesterase [Oscillospiraceae bacterium]|nr:sialate O-acetylesterase [Oscillospiraceae bacterium]